MIGMGPGVAMGIEWRLSFTMMVISTIITVDTGLKRGEYFEIAEV